eukprot:3435919-Rhodomonas_salina.1
MGGGVRGVTAVRRARQDVHGHGQGRVQHRLRGLQNKHGLTCITALCARRSEEHHALDGRASVHGKRRRRRLCPQTRSAVLFTATNPG